jgi:3-oxoacyl-[acyl-carrier protein] reductase
MIKGEGGRSVAVAATSAAVGRGGGDISDPAATSALFDAAETQFGGTDVVVNTAGISTPGLTPVADTEFEMLDRIHAVHVRGTFAVLREASRRGRRGGAIVTLSARFPARAFPGPGSTRPPRQGSRH